MITKLKIYAELPHKFFLSDMLARENGSAREEREREKMLCT
jgi:hypothetical protein